jgi:tripartite-type tricarboxylate transporter receptor subunit TctC
MPTHARYAGLLTGCLMVAGLVPAHAQPRADFAGKTITIISSFGAGGGYTIYADLVARHSARICRGGRR